MQTFSGCRLSLLLHVFKGLFMKKIQKGNSKFNLFDKKSTYNSFCVTKSPTLKRDTKTTLVGLDLTTKDRSGFSFSDI